MAVRDMHFPAAGYSGCTSQRARKRHACQMNVEFGSSSAPPCTCTSVQEGEKKPSTRRFLGRMNWKSAFAKATHCIRGLVKHFRRHSVYVLLVCIFY